MTACRITEYRVPRPRRRRGHDFWLRGTRALGIGCMLALAGCAAQSGQPSLHDVPRQHPSYGTRMLQAARDLADMALREAQIASRSGGDQARAHLQASARAINPELGTDARPGEFGVVRALEGAFEHLESMARRPGAGNEVMAAAADVRERAERREVRNLCGDDQPLGGLIGFTLPGRRLDL